MNLPPFTDRKNELLATAITLVFAYYSLRISLVLPAFREMFANSDAALPLFTGLVLGHSGIVTTLVVVLTAVTLLAIWSRHRLAGLAAAGGIVALGIGTQLLCSATISPFMQMISTMGAQ